MDPYTGYWSNDCYLRNGPFLDDPSDSELRLRRIAMDYARAHVDRVPLVLFARLGRVWGYYQPARQMELDHLSETRELPAAWAGLLMFYLLGLLAIRGAILLRRHECRWHRSSHGRSE